MDRLAFKSNVRQKVDILAASAVISLMSLMLPLALLQVYDRIIPNAAHSTALLLMSIVGAAIVAEMFLKVIRSHLLGQSGRQFELSTTKKLYDRLLSADTLTLRRSGTGENLEKFNAVSAIRDFEAGQPMVLIFDLLFASLFLASIFWVGGIIILWPLATILVCTAYALFMSPSHKRSLQAQLSGDSQSQDYLVAAINASHTIRGLGLEPGIIGHYKKLQQQRALCHYDTETISTTLQNTTHTLMQMCTVCIVCHGAILVNAGLLTTGGLAACTILAGRALQPLKSAIGMWTKFLSASANREHVKSLLEVPQNAVQFITSDTKPGTGRIEFHNVSYQPDAQQDALLPPVSMTIESGQIVSIIGPNASGKSILLQLIAGSAVPTTGYVSIDGIPVDSLTEEDRRACVGLLSQSDDLFAGSIMDNITGMRPELRDKAKAAAQFLGFSDEIEVLPAGYETPVKETSNEFSRGFVQRLCLARAIVNEPVVLLADQAFCAMDQGGKESVGRLLEQLHGHTTIIMVTYDTDFLSLSDQVFDLWQGSLDVEQADQGAQLTASAQPS